jgi:protein-L-isoaspartate(D-aspartate) O-methyltransferase
MWRVRVIDRAAFSPDGIDHNFPIPIAPNATIPTANIAYLLADLLKTDGDVLLLGTGSGYETAILAERCRSVISVETQDISVPVALPQNVALFRADAYKFMSDKEFDGCLVTFGTPYISLTWVAQLKTGGRLVAPLLVGSSCRITAYEKQESGRLSFVEAVAWCPFTAALQAMEA